MGQVFLGVSPGGRRVAVKLIHPAHAGAAQFRERFAREIEAARRVGGFHTAPVVDADPGADPPWMVTAFIEGASLQEDVERRGPLPPDGVRALGAGLAEGLAAIHACGLVHRDLKPGNVILAPDGPRIIDFGIARAIGATTGLTSTGVVVGTLTFMSPEQIRGGPVGPASDVFALGCVLAFAATGKPPFHGDSAATVMFRIFTEPPSLAGIADEPLRRIIDGCLAKAPQDRPPLAALLATLSTLAAAAPAAFGGPVGAPPATGRSFPSAAGIPTHTRPPGAAPGSVQTGLGREPFPPPGMAPAARPQQVGPPAWAWPTGPPQDGARQAGAQPDRGWATGAPRDGAWATGAPPSLARSAGRPSTQPDGARRAGRRSATAARGRRSRRKTVAIAAAGTGVAAAIAVILTVSFSTGGTPPASASAGWGVNSAVPVRDLTWHVPRGGQAPSVAFSPNSTLLAVGGDNGALGYLYNVKTGKLVTTFTKPGSDIADVAFSPDGKLLASANEDGHSYFWKLGGMKLLGGVKDSGNGLAFSPDSTLLATGSGFNAYVWDLATRKLVLNLHTASGIFGEAFSPDGKLLAAAGFSSIDAVFLWNVSDGHRVDTLHDPGGQGVDDVAFSPDGTLLAAADYNGGTYLWDLANHTLLTTLTPGVQSPTEVSTVAFSPDGKQLATAEGSHVYLWDVATHALAGVFTAYHGETVTGMAFGDGGKLLAAVDGNGYIYVRETSQLHY